MFKLAIAPIAAFLCIHFVDAETCDAQWIPRRLRTCPQVCPNNIKPLKFDYTAVSKSKTVSIQSGNAITLDDQAKRKLFQWPQNIVANEHCSISQVAVHISDDGTCHVNFKADQNSEKLQTTNSLPILRNQFIVKLRFCGQQGSSSASETSKIGKPVFAELTVPAFVVESGKQSSILHTTTNPVLKSNFQQIEHVDLEFYFIR